MALRLDSHQHFWRYNDTDYGWMDHNILKQDYLPAYLNPYLRDHGFHGTIAVQARQVDRETDFLLQLQSENSFIKGVIMDARAMVVHFPYPTTSRLIFL